ncbi:unnamed protein product [Hermetia illucens]|uniref:Uncharacterized protein n=1 Tax=Hermetia illucens TaxID=343691 RepID=A0A7R8Z1G5_HERIL|nr:unnamed protein product [Hermetia illucens]
MKFLEIENIFVQGDGCDVVGFFRNRRASEGVNVVVDDDGKLMAIDDALVKAVAEPNEDVVTLHVDIPTDNDHRKTSFVAPPFSLSSVLGASIMREGK